MLRTHNYVIEQLTKKATALLLNPNKVRYFVINGCCHYMCWINEEQIAFGSGEIEVRIHKSMSKDEINTLFKEYIDNSYTERIEYNFWKEIDTMAKLLKEAPWFNMWTPN